MGENRIAKQRFGGMRSRTGIYFEHNRMEERAARYPVYICYHLRNEQNPKRTTDL